jgi:hypothetical protein
VATGVHEGASEGDPTPSVTVHHETPHPAHDKNIKGRRIERGTAVHRQQIPHQSSRIHLIQSRMKSTFALVLLSLSTLAIASHGVVHQHRAASEPKNCAGDSCDGWVQKPNGQASFTSAHNCGTPCKLCAFFFVVLDPPSIR